MNRNATRYVWDQAADLPQMLSDGSTLYVPGVGQWDGTSWAYELRDGLGSVRQLSDAQGNIIQTYTYAPFGELLAAQGTRSSALQYTGEQTDLDTGLVYLRARWYDSATGRFTSRDPFSGFAALPQTLHPYVYVNNNPVNLTDPSGKFAFLPLLVVAILGGIIGGVSYYTIQAIINADPCLGVQWHWQEALFWGGAGGVIGGLLGAGGWWIGVKLGWWGVTAGAGGGAARACANNDCLSAAIRLGQQAIEAVSKMEKIASQLQSKADLLGIQIKGNMQSLNNPIVQNALAKLNNITANPDRIWSGTWNGQKVYEYIQNGIGVVRDAITGQLVTILERTDLSKLQSYVDNGTAKWLK